MKTTCKWLVIAAIVPLLTVPSALGQWKGSTEQSKSEIAVFKLSGPVTERPVDDTFSFGMDKSVSLRDLVARMKEARDADEVKAVVIMMESASIGLAQIEELRQVMSQIRAADKGIYVHADGLSLGSYALFAGASQISIVPTGDIWTIGFHAESPYIRGLLDKIGVTPDFVTCGAYKSAAEILMRKGPSPQAEEMMNWLLDGLFDTVVDLIAQGRDVPSDKVRQWIDDAPYTAEKAIRLGLIDSVEHRQDFAAALQKRFGDDVKFVRNYGKKKGPSVDFSSPFALFSLFSELLGGKTKTDKNAVGIVYVDGAISLGSEEPNPFGGSGGAKSTSIRKALDEAAEDDNIKAVVLRVNSPGGSATASEIILDATRRVKAEKPLVVSMGNIAGSGGYYVACAADTIFADSSTITGSIGVVGGKLVTTEMWNKIGITFKEYERGASAAIMSSARVFSEEERASIQGWMDEIYEVFKGHVKAIRGDRIVKDLDDLAGGRVYTGQQALELGLVDKIGTLDDAIKYAAAQAKLGDYDIRVVPETKNFMEILMEEFSGDEDDRSLSLRLDIPKWGSASPLLEAALPLIRHLDPKRLEGAALMMPEIVVYH